MTRLIDTEVLLKQLDWLEEYDYIEFDAVKRTIDEVPTVDVDSLNAKHEDIGYEKVAVTDMQKRWK